MMRCQPVKTKKWDKNRDFFSQKWDIAKEFKDNGEKIVKIAKFMVVKRQNSTFVGIKSGTVRFLTLKSGTVPPK